MLSLFLLSIMGVSMGSAPVPGDVIFRTEAPFEYAYVEFQGDYSAISQVISAFMADFFKQGLQPASPLMGIYLNYAKETATAELKWQIGMGIQPGSEVKAPLKRGAFVEQEVIYILRKGSYDTVGETYDLLHRTITEKGYAINGPAYERYLSDPAQVAPKDLETEIFIPVRKK